MPSSVSVGATERFRIGCATQLRGSATMASMQAARSSAVERLPISRPYPPLSLAGFTTRSPMLSITNSRSSAIRQR